MIYFLLAVFAFIGLGIWQQIKNNNDYKLYKQQLLTLPALTPGFKVDKSYTHPKGFSFIALDNTNKQIILAAPMIKEHIKIARLSNKDAFIITHKRVNYKDILKSELIIDGQMVSTKSYTGAVVGGLLLGTTGAVVGGSGGKTKVSKDISTIKLKLLLNDINNPSYEVLFYNKLTDKGMIQRAQQTSQNWQDTLSVAIINSI